MSLPAAREGARDTTRFVERLVDTDDVAWLLATMKQGDTMEDEFKGAWRDLRDAAHVVNDQLLKGRFRTFPLFEILEREKCLFYSDKPYLDDIMRVLVARQRDITPYVHEHITMRRKRAGNAMFGFRGRTGLTKSSCMLHLGELHNDLRGRIIREGPDALLHRMTIDVVELPDILEKLTFGDVAFLDESPLLTGEGAKTARDNLQNTEETLRASGVDLHHATPTEKDHAATQAILEAKSVDWDNHQTLFEVWLGDGAKDYCLGVAVLDWCSPETWAAYQPIKAKSIERTKRAQFHGVVDIEPVVRRLFSQKRLLTRIKHMGHPTKEDWKAYLVEFGSSASTSQQSAMASRLQQMMSFARDAEAQEFQDAFGFEPPQAMVHAARGTKDVGDMTEL